MAKKIVLQDLTVLMCFSLSHCYVCNSLFKFW